jgi:hypothetical protein
MNPYLKRALIIWLATAIIGISYVAYGGELEGKNGSSESSFEEVWISKLVRQFGWVITTQEQWDSMIKQIEEFKWLVRKLEKIVEEGKNRHDLLNMTEGNAFIGFGVDLTKYQGSADLIRIKTYPNKHEWSYPKSVPIPPERNEK